MKRSPIKRNARLRSMSAKRRAELSRRVQVGIDIPPRCELCEFLYDVDSYREFAGRAAEWQFRVVDPHHVHNPPRQRWDDPGNVVAACRVCHEWHHECFSRAGRMVATEALCRAGRFDRDRTRLAVGYDPIAFVEADYQSGVFSSDPTLDAIALILLGRF